MYDASDPRGRRRWVFPTRLACRRWIGRWHRIGSGDERGRRATGHDGARVKVKVMHSGRISRVRIRIRIEHSAIAIATRLHLLPPLRVLATTPHPHAPSTPARDSPRPPRLDTQRTRAGTPEHTHARRRSVARTSRHSVLCAVCGDVY